MTQLESGLRTATKLRFKYLLNPFKELQPACMVSGSNNILPVYLIIKCYFYQTFSRDI